METNTKHSLIQLVNVTKSYEKGDQLVTPLSNLNLSVGDGEFVALMGPSGSGKTTLLNLIAGIDQPTEGQVIVGGTDIATLSRSKLAEWRSKHVGYIFQLYHLVPVLTAYENIELPLILHNLSRKERQLRVNLALEAVGLLDRHDHYPRQLSGGQEQRVAIARALVTAPAIVVADEPTGDLDKTSAEATLTLLQRLNREMGKTFVMVTHDPHAASAASRIVYLDKGLIVDTPDMPVVPESGSTLERIEVPPVPKRSEPNPVSAPMEGRVSPRKKVKSRKPMFVTAALLTGAVVAWFVFGGDGMAKLNASGEQVAEIIVTTKYSPETLTVAAGKPVLLKVTKTDDSACSRVFEIPEFNISKELVTGQTAEFRFTPVKGGTVDFRCGMDMMHGAITVVADAAGGAK
ncbi:MAG: ATP-binding cassette domain-containing protein [Candidatus Sumerlaeaceae bacterium]|nr:ATP-binding cassette domain-containing protein [Candidatus Sumerlaeaceae bacterium]